MTTLRIASTLIGQALLLAFLLSGCGPDADTQPDAASADTGPDGLHAPSSPDATLLAVSVTCTANAQCGSGFCADGVCCDTACDGSCRSCALTGKIGTCSPVLEVQDDTCNGDATCDSQGNCRSPLGKACSVPSDCASGSCVDGVCCASSACGTCQSCAVPGSVGACAPVAKFTDDPDSQCEGSSTCNGLGACQLENGSACQTASECVSQQCVDGVCCEEACSGTCYSCNQPGNQGHCKALDGAEDHAATTTCDGASICTTPAGASPECKLKDGEPCKASEQCLNGSCLTSYRDADGDGYGGTFVQRCERTPQPGYVLRSGDCCDRDAYAHANQTYYFGQPNACGSWDWNCNGVVEPSHTNAIGAPAKCGCITVGTAGQNCTTCR